jgi:hypothetical protein
LSEIARSLIVRKELAAMNKRIVHDQLSWMMLQWYVLNTYVRKDESEWYSQKSHQKCDNYDTTEWSESKSEIKELAILERWDWRNQYTEHRQKKDYSDSVWMHLNLNVNQEDIDEWKVNMKLKNQYEHSENQCQEMHQWLLKNSKETSEEDAFKKSQSHFKSENKSSTKSMNQTKQYVKKQLKKLLRLLKRFERCAKNKSHWINFRMN